MSSAAFKIAFVGSHGVGKTTLCYGLAARLKARDIVLEVVHEVARRSPLPINQDTGLASQAWILHTQIAEEVVAAARYPVVVCDRSALDNYVYLLLAAGPQEGLDALVDWWMKTYDLLVHVPVVDGPSEDGIRATDPAFQRAVDERLTREIAARGLDAVTLEPGRRSSWLEHCESLVWERVRSPQLRLL